MSQKQPYIKAEELEVYQLARELSRTAWKIYQGLDWQDKKTMGDQFLTAADSIGANIVEGYKRYHFLDKIKFYYNSRASFAEADTHWIELLREREKVDSDSYKHFKAVAGQFSIKLSNFIKVTYQSKTRQ